MEHPFKLSEDLVRKVIKTVDAGLSSGLGVKKPGSMCVEAAVCYALGLPHGDDPKCVDYAIRRLKIALNDSAWSSKESRGRGMRKLAVLQLGTLGNFACVSFAKKVAKLSARYAEEAKQTARYAAESARYAAESAVKFAESAVKFAESAGFAAESARFAAESARYAAAVATAESAGSARDKVLADFAEDVAQILIEMNVPAVKYLYLLK